MRSLRVIVGRYPHTDALLAAAEGTFETSDGLAIEFRTLREEPAAFSRMANDAEFDVCEMPIVSYLVARDNGAQIQALPIYVTRGFDQRRLVRSVASGIQSPSDLEGQAVGVRYYGFTDGTWARVALARTFGVDLDKITWVTSTRETVSAAVLPANVRYMPDADLVAMAEEGALAGLILNLGQQLSSDRLAPLFGDVDAIERSWFEATGVFPIHHVIVARTELLSELSSLASDLTRRFLSAKEHLLSRLTSDAELTDEERAIGATRSFTGLDPLPFGVANNRAALEMIVQACFDQHLLSHRASLEAAFPEM